MDVVEVLPLLLLIAAAAVTVAWIRAERQSGLQARVILGGAMSSLWVVNAILWSHLIPTYERSFHRRAIHGAGELLRRGQVDAVRQAVEVYNSTVTNSGSYSASRAMNASVRSALGVQPTNAQPLRPANGG